MESRQSLPPPRPRTTARIEVLPDEPKEASKTSPALNVETLTVSDRPKQSFAAMKQGKGKKTYITPTASIRQPIPSQVFDSPAAPPARTHTLTKPLSETPTVPSDFSTASVSHIASPTNPTATSPAAGFELLRRIASLSAPETWSYMSHYPAHVIPAVLSSLMEPESLGQILCALCYGVERDEVTRVRVILEGLRQTPRWRINVAMLDTFQEAAGRRAWLACGAEGSF